MKREAGNGEKFILYISSFFLYFFPLYPFPTSKFVIFCRKMLNTALLSRMSQKSQPTRYEEIILGRICCEEAPQVVPACNRANSQIGPQKNQILKYQCLTQFQMHISECICEHAHLLPIQVFLQCDNKQNEIAFFSTWFLELPANIKTHLVYFIFQSKFPDWSVYAQYWRLQQQYCKYSHLDISHEYSIVSKDKTLILCCYT